MVRREYKNMLVIILAYVLYYTVWLFAGGYDPAVPFLQFIRMRASSFYLFPWLVRNHLYWIAAAVSALAALYGRKYLSWISCFGALAGIVIGELLGPRPGDPTGHTHHGWYIWILVFLCSLVIGAVTERYAGRERIRK